MISRKMRSLVCAVVITTVSLVGGLDSARAQMEESYSISGVIVEGNRRIDTNAIKAQIKAGSGRVTTAQINEDVKTLYNSGFFDQVTVSAITDTSGERKLKYSLVEKPVARKVLIKGNDEVSESDLADVLKFDSPLRGPRQDTGNDSQGRQLLSGAGLLRRLARLLHSIRWRE